jgi:hypothetical protein
MRTKRQVFVSHAGADTWVAQSCPSVLLSRWRRELIKGLRDCGLPKEPSSNCFTRR